jgi:hypothetical protein
MVQALDTRCSSGAVCDGWVAGRLYDQRCLRTRLLRTHVPEAWAKAQRPRQVQGARHTRRVTMLKTLAFLSLDLPGQESPGSTSLCGRQSVRVVSCLRLCDKHVQHAGLDVTGENT